MNNSKETTVEDFECISKILDVPFKNVLALYSPNHFLTSKIAFWAQKDDATIVDPSSILEGWDILMLSELIKNNNVTHLFLSTRVYKQLIAKSEEAKLNSIEAVILSEDFPSRSLAVMHGEKHKSIDLYYLDYRNATNHSCEFSKIYDYEFGILTSDNCTIFSDAKSSSINLNDDTIQSKEIEHAITLHPEVIDAVVTLDRDENTKISFLGAYVQPKFKIQDKQSVETLEKELKRDLKKFLPSHMIPEVWTFVDAFNFTQEGHIEKNDLPKHMLQCHKDSHIDTSRNEIEEKLSSIWCELLQIKKVALEDNFFELGGDSILSIQLVAKARKLGLVMSMDQIFDAQTIKELAKVVSLENAEPIQLAEKVFKDESEAFGLSPIQSWFLTHGNENPHHYNQSVLLVSEDKLDENIVEQSLQRLVQHFPSLRLRFKQSDSMNWIQYYQRYEDTQEYINGICGIEDLSRFDEEESNTFMLNIMNKLHNSLNFEAGLVFQACLFQNSIDGDYLFIVAHHLVVDTVSWHILLDDLQIAYANMVKGKQEETRLVPEHTSYRQWIQTQQDQVRGGTLNEEVKYWHNVLKSCQNSFLKESNKGIVNTISEMKEISLKLSSNKTQALLQVAPKIYKTQVNDLLITALCLTIHEVFGHDTVSFMLEGHGREKLSQDMELSKTVGWFTSNFPVSISIDKKASLKDQITFVKHVLQSIPNKGVGYGMLRYLSKDSDNTLNSLKEPELSFNYLGQMDSNLSEDDLFQLSEKSTGEELSAKTKRPTLFEINCRVLRKQFILRIEYNQNIHDRTFVKRIAEVYLERISDIIEHCLSNKESDYLASDFPLAKLDQETLEAHFGQENNLEDIYPLSPMQEGLLFQKLYRPDSDAYLVQNLFSINQLVDVNKFKRAWEILLNRHDILRTGFKWKGLSNSLQFVKRSVSLNWKEFDWRDIPTDEEVKDKLNCLLLEDRSSDFDYDKPPLVRLYFIYLPKEQYRFIFTFHHLLIDGWCSSILFDELAHIYKRLVENKAPKLSPKKPFKVFIEWIINNNNRAAKDFFKTYLNNASMTSLSKTLSKQKDTAYQYYEEFENHKYAFSKEQTKRFNDFVRGQKITISSLFQAAWYKTLQYLNQQDDITFGVVLSGRSAPISGIEDMVGLFINTLPLRVTTDEKTSVKKLLQDVSERSLQLQKLSHIPLFEVLNWVGQTGENKLFDTIMIFENHYNDPNSQNPESLGLSLLDTYEPTEYPLTLLIAPGDKLVLDITYKKEFFTLLQVKSIAYRLVDILFMLIQDIEALVSSICPVTEQEKSMVLDVWNHTRSDVSSDKLHQVFEKQVILTPDNVALIEGEIQTSFEQLNKLSNQIANMLLKEGIREKQKVAVSLSRSKNLVASILAILKIGAIYVPVDPTHPQERKNYIVSDAMVQAIIGSNISWINFETERTLVQVDLDKIDLTQYSSNNVPAVLDIEDDILTYTSSSTGNPKGVMQTHRAHMNRFQWMWESYPFSENDICCQKTPIGFVDAVWETLGPLLKGVPLVILSDEIKQDPRRFIYELNRTKVTRFNTVPSFLSALLEVSEKEDIKLDHLTICTVSGEVCSLEIAQRFAKQYPDTKLLNIYGSTEVCADATCYEYKGEKGLIDSIPIGNPINNFNVYIVDRNMNLLSAGIIGEICISGIGVAQGYYNNNTQSKERFIKNPFSEDDDHKVLFKTGDFGRYLSKGAVEYIGRQDDLVKINGCRIELNEIRFALSSCEFVKEAVVIVKGEVVGEKRIVAFVVTTEEKLDQVMLRERILSFLKEKIPAYMLPSFITFLSKIPLNANGKVDYKILRSSNLDVGLTINATPPSSKLEETLCKMWSDILSSTISDVELNFFEAGGHSILATKFAIRIKQELGYQVSIKDIFENPTVKKMAVYLEILSKDASEKEKGMDFKPISRSSRIKINIEGVV